MTDTYKGMTCSRCGYERPGAHYNIWNISSGGVSGLRHMFPEAEADEMNFVLFSTSGVHGTYTTIEKIEDSLIKYGENPTFLEKEDDEYPDDYYGNALTVTVYHPRIIGIGYGNVEVKLEDISFLKKLRESSWDVIRKIGA